MKNTEYGIWVETLSDNEGGDPVYERWDSLSKSSWADKPNIVEAFKEVDDGLIAMRLCAKLGTESQVSTEKTTWRARVSLAGYDGTLMYLTPAYATVEKANYSALAILRTWFEGIIAKKFLDEMAPRAAAVGLVLEPNYIGSLDNSSDAEYIHEIFVHYGNDVPADGSMPDSDDSLFSSARGEILAISLSDPTWQNQIANTITFHEARIELAKFSLEFPDVVLRFSPDGRFF